MKKLNLQSLNICDNMKQCQSCNDFFVYNSYNYCDKCISKNFIYIDNKSICVVCKNQFITEHFDHDVCSPICFQKKKNLYKNDI